MKKFLPLTILLMSFTRLDFNAVQLGTPADEIVRCYGEPYSVKELRDKGLEYRYIERVSVGRELMYENHYYLHIENGVLVSKRFREQTRPPFNQTYRTDPNSP